MARRDLSSVLNGLSFYNDSRSDFGETAKSLWNAEPEERSFLGSVTKRLSSLNPMNSISSAAERTARLKWFFLFFFIAIGCFGVSFMFLPIVLLFPAKFALMFSLGSICMQAAMVYLKASFYDYLTSLFTRNSFLLTLLYFVSLFGCIWAAVVQRSYLLVVFWTIIETGCIVYYIFSFFPGGTSGLAKLSSYGCSMMKAVCCYGSKSLLPI
mmetsp:Transcript_13252/g.24846  ORF Transcript_13252/g.24846 Transcript_13252/m.24846 type:complete len:211 (-) Transcript_13252:2155-2787(-)